MYKLITEIFQGLRLMAKIYYIKIKYYENHKLSPPL